MVNLFNVFEKEYESICKEINTPLEEIDELFLGEVKEILQSMCYNIFDVFRELTFLYVRYTEDQRPYKDIPPFIEEKSPNKVFEIICYMRNFIAKNLCDFYELVIAEAATIIQNTLKNKAIFKGNLLNVIRDFQAKEDPEEKFVNFEVSMCEFAEYASYIKGFIDRQKFPPEPTEFLLAHVLYFSYVNREDSEKWSECGEFIVKTFNSFTNDASRPDSFLNLNGYALYELYKMNDFLERKNLRDVNLWALSGYRYSQEKMIKDFDDFRDAIDREEYSEIMLKTCKENIESAKNILSSYLFLPWTVTSHLVQQAQKIIAYYQMAEFKIKQFKD